MKTIRKTVALFMGLMLTIGASGQQYQTLEITLDKAIEIALDENPTIKIAEMEIERQDYVKKETQGHLMPTVGVTGSYTRAIVKSEMGKGVSFDPDNMINAAASLNLPLFAPSVYKTLKLNKEQMRAAVEAARGSKITLVNEIKKSYYNILLAEKSLEVLRVSEQTLTETVTDIQSKLQNGLASEYDLLTAEVQLSNLKPTILQTMNAIDVANKLLKVYLSIPENIDIKVTGNLDQFMSDTKYNTGSTDISNNTDLKAIEIQINVLEQNLKVQRTARMPVLSGFANFQMSGRDPLDFSKFAGSGTGGDPTPVKKSTAFMWTHPFSAGVQISIPIFSGFTNSRKEKQIKNLLSQTKMQRDYLEDNLNVQLNNAANAVITAAAMVNANNKTIGQAQKAYDISKTRYDAGMGTMLELNTAELQLTQAKLNRTQAVYDYLSAQADYEKILGRDQ